MARLETPRDGQRSQFDRTATPAEVIAAIEELTPPELLRLRSYARFRMRALAHASLGRNDEDLMSEAVTSTLAGVRRWNKDAVNMVGHLCGVMRSLSSHWSAYAANSGETAWPTAGAEETPIDLASPSPDPEREAAARQELDRIKGHFTDDALVTKVIEAIDQGLKGPDIKEQLDLSQREFETVMKRLRRGSGYFLRKEEERA